MARLCGEWGAALPVVAMLGLAGAFEAHAQRGPIPSSQEGGDDVASPHALAPDAVSGRVGQRQTRSSASETAGIVPMARVSNRIPNRIQSRIRNRVDEDYDPRANTTAPFRVAGERIRAATSGRRH